jgi:DNA-binding YbaB/EbfC family protein
MLFPPTTISKGIQERTMVDIMGMMKKAQAMQAQLADAQEELARLEVEGQSGGGLVKISLTGKGEMKSIQLDPSLLTPTDKEMTEDLILAAFVDAKAKADRAASEKMQALTAGLPLPPGMKLPF